MVMIERWIIREYKLNKDKKKLFKIQLGFFRRSLLNNLDNQCLIIKVKLKEKLCRLCLS